MSTDNGMTPTAPSAKIQKSPPPPSSGRGFAKLVGGAAIVGLNVTFLGPSAVYYCLWIAGLAMFIGGIASMCRAAGKTPQQYKSDWIIEF